MVRRGQRSRSGVNLTAANTAIVLDSTADFPEAHERFENWRMVPLYVRFGDESRRDYVEIGPQEFYARLRTVTELPTTSQPTPGDFLAVYEELGELRADLLAAALRKAVRHVRERAKPLPSARGQGARRRHARPLRRRSRCSAFAIQRRLEPGTTDEEIDELIERFRDDAGLLFTVDTLEFLRRAGASARQPRSRATCSTSSRSSRSGRRGPADQARPGQRRRRCRSSRAVRRWRPTRRTCMSASRTRRRPSGAGAARARRAPSPAGADRHRDDARRRRRHACRARHRRLVLVRGPRGLTPASVRRNASHFVRQDLAGARRRTCAASACSGAGPILDAWS